MGKIRVRKILGRWYVQERLAFGLVWISLRRYNSWDSAYFFAHRYAGYYKRVYSRTTRIPWELPRG